MTVYDETVVGGGIAGSILTLSLLQKGRRVSMISPQHMSDGSNSITTNKQPGRSTLGAHYKDIPTAREMVYDSLKTLIDLKNLGFPFLLANGELNLECFEGSGQRDHPSRNTAYIPTKVEHVSELNDVCDAIQTRINELWETEFTDNDKRFLLTIYPHSDPCKNQNLLPIQYVKPLLIFPIQRINSDKNVDESILWSGSYQSCEMQINGRYLTQWLWDQINQYKNNQQFRYIKGTVREIINQSNEDSSKTGITDVLKEKSIRVRFAKGSQPDQELLSKTVILCAYDKNFQLHASYIQHLHDELSHESDDLSSTSRNSPRHKFEVASRIKLIASVTLDQAEHQCSLMKVYSQGSMVTPWKHNQVKYTDQSITNLASQTIHHGTETLSSNSQPPIFQPYWSNPIFKLFYAGTKYRKPYEKVHQASFSSTKTISKKDIIDKMLPHLTRDEMSMAYSITISDEDISNLEKGTIPPSIEEAAKMLMQHNFKRDYPSQPGKIESVESGLVITSGSADLTNQKKSSNKQTIHERKQPDLLFVQPTHVSQIDQGLWAFYTRKAMHANRPIEAAEKIILSKDRQKQIKRLIHQMIIENRQTFSQTIIGSHPALIQRFNQSVSTHYQNVIHKIVNFNNNPLGALSPEEFNHVKNRITQDFQVELAKLQVKVAESLPRRNRADSFGSNNSDTDGTTTSCEESLTSARNHTPPESPARPKNTQYSPDANKIYNILEKYAPMELLFRVNTPVAGLAGTVQGLLEIPEANRSSTTSSHKSFLHFPFSSRINKKRPHEVNPESQQPRKQNRRK
ncbi:MAG: hypothetical protein CL816_07580 [Coxiellaceae bacterium]|nr:hypothetical protein [Coxiellaceae bacterium]